MQPHRSGSQGNASAAPPSIDALRQRARHRLIGAAVLVLLGVVGFSLLLETQPRSLPVDIPIVIPAKPVLSAPSILPLPAAASTASAGSGVAAVDSLGPSETVVSADGATGLTPAPKALPPDTASSSAATAAQKPSAALPASAVSALRVESSTPQAKSSPPSSTAAVKSDHPENIPPAAVKTAPQPDDQPPARPLAGPTDGERARALLNGQTPDAAATPRERIIVQVGAFADAARARETRIKLERAGLKTYTHVADTAEGRRIRVRLGPFATRAQADKAAARVKALGLPAAILTL